MPFELRSPENNRKNNRKSNGTVGKPELASGTTLFASTLLPPARSSSSSISLLSWRAASCIGVFPSVAQACNGSAPAVSSTCTTASSAAECSGVWPALSTASTLAPA